MIEWLISILQEENLAFSGKEIAELLWLATQLKDVHVIPKIRASEQYQFIEQSSSSSDESIDSSASIVEQTTKPYTSSTSSSSSNKVSLYSDPYLKRPGFIPFKTPTVGALRNRLDLERALRPLMRKVESTSEVVLDEEATAISIAETGTFIPTLRPAMERWLDLELVIEISPSTMIWYDTLMELQKMFENQRTFRYMRIWCLHTENSTKKVNLFLGGINLFSSEQKSRSFKELKNPTGRRLLLLISDGLSTQWQDKTFHIYNLLMEWSKDGPVAMVQLLPTRLWQKSALGIAFPAQLGANKPGAINDRLIATHLPVWAEATSNLEGAFNLPIVTLSPSMVWRWASVVAGSCSVNATGIVLALKLLKQPEQKLQETSFSTNPKVIVNRFFSRASPLAQKLVKLMAIVPIEMPIIQLLQQTLLPESKQEHIAEIFMSGLLQPHFEDIYQYENAYQYRVESDHFEQKNNVFTNNVSELRQYDFAPGVRGYLLDGISKSDARIVLETVSQYIARKLNRSTQNFVAFLSSTWADDEKQAVSRFAEVAESVLRRMGGEYAALVKKLETERFVESFQQPYKQPVSENKRWRALAWDDRPEDFLDSLSERLRQNKVDVVITNQVEDFDELFHDDYFWDFLILDILDGTSDPEYPSKAGIRLANRVRRSDPDIPIIFLTDDESIILSGEIIIPGPVLQMPKSYPRGMLTLDILDFAKKNLEPYDFSKVFVIYGHGKQANGLKDKVIHSLKEHGIDSVLISPENVMNSISEGLVDAMRSCGAFVAICTPDDQVADNWYQPRQNALLEIGIAMGLPNGFQRLVILQRAGAEPDKQAKLPSDLGGAFTLQFYDEHDEPIRRMINALENRKIKIQRPA